MITEYQAIPKVLRFERMPGSGFGSKYQYDQFFRGEYPEWCIKAERRMQQEYIAQLEKELDEDV